jgi:UPF0716 protein FxsA
MAWLLVLFTIVPLAEVYLLYLLGDVMGFWPTVGLVLGTALLGAALAKSEGLRVWREWREALSRGQLPEEGILGGLLVLIGGVLLVAPGVLTDLTGLVLLFPPSRRVVARIVRKRLERRIAEGRTTFRYRVEMGDLGVLEELHARAQRGVVDVEGEVVEERRPGERRAGRLERER